jgi:general stress protein 26
MRNPEQTIGNMIDKQGVAFIASVDEDGFPNMKAMLPPRKREGIKSFWFTTNTSSMRAAQYWANPKAGIYFYDKRTTASSVWLYSANLSPMAIPTTARCPLSISGWTA